MAAGDVPVELRGAGQASRQVNNFCSPEAFPADRLIAVEVLTPAGNWSSYPPHKHDEDIPGVEVALEEIYYYEVAGDGFGYQRVYTSGPGREIDLCVEVRSGDAIVMPHGYHGPVDGRAGLRPVLPQCDGRAGGAGLALPRRPRARLDPRFVGRPGDRSAAAAGDARPGARHETDRGPGARALPRRPAQRARRRAAAPDRRLLRHLRPRQRRRLRAGAARVRARDPERLPYVLARNEQGMVHAAAAFARHAQPPVDAGVHARRSAPARRTWSPAPRWRRSTGCRSCCCRATSSRRARRARCCRSSRTRRPTTCRSTTASSRCRASGTAINRPEQLASALLAAMRVLTDPVETGAVTLALPQDVQAEAYDWPEALFERRVWRVRRPLPEPDVLAEAAALLRGAQPAADRGRRRHDLRRGHGRAARARRGDRHPGGRDAGRQGLAALRPPAARRRHRRHRHDGGQRARRARPTSCSASARAGATSRRRRGRRSPTPACASSTSTSRRSTPSSTPACRSWPTRARAGGARRGARRLAGRRRTSERAPRARRRVGRDRRARPTRLGHGPLPAQSEVIGAVNRVAEPARRRGLRGGQHARRPAQAVAHARPEGLPRRVRLLVHGLRDRRRPGRQARRARPRGVRDGRRRLLPDDGPGDRHGRRRRASS